MSSQFDKIHYILGVVVVLLVLSNIPTTVEEEIEYTISVPKNVTKTITKTVSVPVIVEEDIQVPYNETVEEITTQESEETLFENNLGSTIRDGYYRHWHYYLEKDDYVTFEFDILNSADAYILSEVQYSTFTGETSSYYDHYYGWGERTLTHYCNYAGDYAFVISDENDPHSGDTQIESMKITRFYIEDVVEYHNVTKYETETISHIEYQDEIVTETIIETIYEDELVTETLTRKTTLLYNLLNIK